MVGYQCLQVRGTNEKSPAFLEVRNRLSPVIPGPGLLMSIRAPARRQLLGRTPEAQSLRSATPVCKMLHTVAFRSKQWLIPMLSECSVAYLFACITDRTARAPGYYGGLQSLGHPAAAPIQGYQPRDAATQPATVPIKLPVDRAHSGTSAMSPSTLPSRSSSSSHAQPSAPTNRPPPVTAPDVDLRHLSLNSSPPAYGPVPTIVRRASSKGPAPQYRPAPTSVPNQSASYQHPTGRPQAPHAAEPSRDNPSRETRGRHPESASAPPAEPHRETSRRYQENEATPPAKSFTYVQSSVARPVIAQTAGVATGVAANPGSQAHPAFGPPDGSSHRSPEKRPPPPGNPSLYTQYGASGASAQVATAGPPTQPFEVSSGRKSQGQRETMPAPPVRPSAVAQQPITPSARIASTTSFPHDSGPVDKSHSLRASNAPPPTVPYAPARPNVNPSSVYTTAASGPTPPRSSDPQSEKNSKRRDAEATQVANPYAREPYVERSAPPHSAFTSSPAIHSSNSRSSDGSAGHHGSRAAPSGAAVVREKSGGPISVSVHPAAIAAPASRTFSSREEETGAKRHESMATPQTAQFAVERGGAPGSTPAYVASAPIPIPTKQQPPSRPAERDYGRLDSRAAQLGEQPVPERRAVPASAGVASLASLSQPSSRIRPEEKEPKQREAKSAPSADPSVRERSTVPLSSTANTANVTPLASKHSQHSSPEQGRYPSEPPAAPKKTREQADRTHVPPPLQPVYSSPTLSSPSPGNRNAQQGYFHGVPPGSSEIPKSVASTTTAAGQPQRSPPAPRWSPQEPRSPTIPEGVPVSHSSPESSRFSSQGSTSPSSPTAPAPKMRR